MRKCECKLARTGCVIYDAAALVLRGRLYKEINLVLSRVNYSDVINKLTRIYVRIVRMQGICM